MALAPTFREEHADAIVMFIRDKVRDAKARGVVLGLSGGLDSTVVAALCVRALGPEKVLGILMPEATTPPKEMDDAVAVAKWLGIEHVVARLEPVMEAVRQLLGGDVEPRAFGNVKARARMTVLYYQAQTRGRLVMGTGNKSEILTGYFTKHGDGGVDYQPIGDLYKTQVRELARHLGVPANIVEKPPSAHLAPGQTDEGELGIRYEDLDRVLLGIELGMGDAEIAERTDMPEKECARVRGIVQATRHKRRAPLMPKLGIRTPGLDWRE
jgi:NAD+ synthase